MKVLASLLCVIFFNFSWAETKIGFVDIQRLIQNSPQSEEASLLIAEEFKPQEQKILELNEEVKKTMQDFEINKAIMTENRVAEINSELFLKRRNLERLKEDFRETVSRKRNLKLSEVLLVIRKAIVMVSEQENYDLVLYFEGNAAYAKRSLDISDKVLEYLEKVFKNPSAK